MEGNTVGNWSLIQLETNREEKSNEEEIKEIGLPGCDETEADNQNRHSGAGGGK